jgi:hypothetical protein
VKPSHVANDHDLIDRTIEVWQARLRRGVSREEARQIAENVTGLFSILHEWSRAEMLATANDAATPNNSEVRHES